MNIVVLDGFALNPGDLSWEKLHTLGNVTVYERTPAELVEERAKDAEIVLTNKTLLFKDTLQKLPKLQYIGVLATGYNVVDLDYARERGITVTNVPAYSTESVAQMTFALLLELCLSVGQHNQAVKEGEWCRSKDFCFWKSPLTELSGKTMGIIGFGSIGQRVAEIALAFGMKVLVYSRTKKDYARENLEWTSLDLLLKNADVVSLHCPLTDKTRQIIDKNAIEKMKQGALLLNTSRGPLLQDEAVADALNEGKLGGAAMDVLTEEPPKADNPLLSAKNCIITPHVAWATKEARGRLMDIASANVKAFLEGKPQNVVSG